ncbi:DUF5997 family protein [Corynebacterium lipophiloflavum]|uniref:Uncharacterized protein n=1 Tax=Corynebacterium lipophiloflavum (strain ATCC 700352 / DSM 44291 / CCUG 37336 / JCM 10383 / DMMZ 1944) TaxID=525263 RepID=C0XPX7_CORLD|nr:DUF5997 family protein [Corynebacterium lipophiloflavum]EEI17708.1 hypothetical protein HMPREF0298_0497 [Corynebacterium lipophiloflavum DSM 44291]
MTDSLTPSGTAMKPATAAAKLGIYLPATPDEFREGAITHARLRELMANPPEWLTELRLNGPHPRPEVARKLGISITALKKNGMDSPLTTEQISALLKDQPEWLRAARATHAAER